MKRLPLICVVIAASITLAAVVFAAAKSAAMPWSPETLADRSDWFSVSLRGEQVGYLHVRYRTVPDGYELENHLELRGQAQGVAFHQIQEERFRFDAKPPYRVRHGELFLRQDDSVRRQVFDNQPDVLWWQESGKPRERLPASRFSLEDSLKPMYWIANGAFAGARASPLTALEWDWEKRADHREQYRLVARDSRQIRLEQLSEGSLLKSEMSFLPDGTPLRMQVTGSLVMERTSEAQALAFKASTDLYYGGGIAVDRPLGEVRGLRRLVMTVPTGIAIPEAPGQVFATDTGELRLTRPAASAPVGAGEREANRVLDRRYGQGDADLLALAKRAVAGGGDTRDEVRRLVAFVAAYLEDSPVLQPVTASEIRQMRRGDCTEHAELFVALARQLGIPAREVSGLVYLGDHRRRFGGHAWAEVAVDDHWLSVDPTWNEVGVDASHIRFGEGRAGEESLLLAQEGLSFSVKVRE